VTTFFSVRFRVPVCFAIALAGAVPAGCGSSATSSSQSKKAPSAAATTEAQIKHNWLEFFNASTPTATAVSLLQDGTKFAAVIDAEAKSPFAKEASATVSGVKLTSPSTATVTYTLKLAGQPIPGLKNASGMALKTGGTWEVADASFCQLLKLEGSAPPACHAG
jgi:hypothetical protein